MPKQNRQMPLKIGAHVALDYLNTVVQTPKGPVDFLGSDVDLQTWFTLCELATEAELAAIFATATQAEVDRAQHEISAFRERFRSFVAAASGAADVLCNHPIIAEINGILRNAPQMLQISPAAAEAPAQAHLYDMTYQTQLRTVGDLLPRIASACADLICTADFHHIRNCAGTGCTLYFLDLSKSHKRRWCAMDLCGNRAKAAAYRKR